MNSIGLQCLMYHLNIAMSGLLLLIPEISMAHIIPRLNKRGRHEKNFRKKKSYHLFLLDLNWHYTPYPYIPI